MQEAKTTQLNDTKYVIPKMGNVILRLTLPLSSFKSILQLCWGFNCVFTAGAGLWLVISECWLLLVCMLLWPSVLVNQSSDSRCAGLLESFKIIGVPSCLFNVGSIVHNVANCIWLHNREHVIPVKTLKTLKLTGLLIDDWSLVPDNTLKMKLLHCKGYNKG